MDRQKIWMLGDRYRDWERDSYNLEGGLDQLMNWHPYEFGLPPGFDANGPIPRAEQPPS